MNRPLAFAALIALGGVSCAQILGIEETTTAPPEAKSIRFYYFFSKPITEDFTVPDFLVVNQEELDLFVDAASGGEATADPDLGHFSAHSVDCPQESGNGSAPELSFVDGIQYRSAAIEADDKAFSWYFDEAGAPLASRNTTVQASRALGGFFNHPRGFASITSVLAETEEVVAEYRVFIRAGALSTMTVVPNADEALMNPPEQGNWGCLPSQVGEPQGDSATITYNVSFLTQSPEKTLVGLRFRACASANDLACQQVDAERFIQQDDLVRDADGNVNTSAAQVGVEVPLRNGPWQGYIIIDDPNFDYGLD